MPVLEKYFSKYQYKTMIYALLSLYYSTLFFNAQLRFSHVSPVIKKIAEFRILIARFR